ncbi:hypothetical protein BKA61DRAFT_654987, partial [Leptodontidium sp. MPI-SDFR-AT-0119]
MPAKVFVISRSNHPPASCYAPSDTTQQYDAIHEHFKENFVTGTLKGNWNATNLQFQMCFGLLIRILTHVVHTISRRGDVKDEEIAIAINITGPFPWKPILREALCEMVWGAARSVDLLSIRPTETIRIASVDYVISAGRCSSFVPQIPRLLMGGESRTNRTWISPGEMVAVFDLGGYTTDISVVECYLNTHPHPGKIHGSSFEEPQPVGTKQIHDKIKDLLRTQINRSVDTPANRIQRLEAAVQSQAILEIFNRPTKPKRSYKFAIGDGLSLLESELETMFDPYFRDLDVLFKCANFTGNYLKYVIVTGGGAPFPRIRDHITEYCQRVKES